MHQTLVNGWQQWEQGKNNILRAVEALDARRQRTPANPRVWSPLQIIQHLTLFERSYLDFMEAGAKSSVGQKSASRSLMIPVLLFLMRRRISIPTIPEMEPKAETPGLAELAADWAAVREAIRLRLEAVTDATLTRPIAANPLLGPLAPGQVLELLNAHQDYHASQILG